MRVFCKEEDNKEQIIGRIKELFPFDFGKEKIKLKEKTAYGFEDKKIKILSVSVSKERHIEKVIKNLVSRLSTEQKELLLKQLDSRLDENLHFYLRMEKERLLEGEYWITDTGNCFHFKIVIAAYPHKRKVAERILKDILMPEKQQKV